MLLILFDIHRNILSAQGIIQYSASESISNVEVVLEANNIYLDIFSNSVLNRRLTVVMAENIFQPFTISAVCCQNSTTVSVNKESNFVKMNFKSTVDKTTTNKDPGTFKITFRLQITDETVIEKCMSRNITAIKFKDFLKSKCEKIKMYNLICTNCCIPLIEKKISFQSVHIYEEGMSELAETWFCHKHNEHSLQPIENSLYIGDVCFYFHDSLMKHFAITEHNKEYQCRKCFSVLSLKKKMSHPNFTGFFCDKVMLQNLEGVQNSIQQYKYDVALFSFCTLVEGILKSALSCKIYLQSKIHQTAECILLWINSQNVAQFLLHEINDDDIPSETEFKTKEVHKVLYRISSSNCELAKKWRHDFNVDFFQISDNMMKVIRELLQKSCKYYPDDQDTINGFSVGYLPAYAFVS